MLAQTTTPMFPLFKERFWSSDTETETHAVETVSKSPKKGAAAKLANLSVLDLGTLPRDDSPPTELRARKEKLAFFERQCSHIDYNLYVGAEYVAKSRDVLRDSGITHVVNCVGFLYPPYFEDELQYNTLYLQDKPAEDIICILYDIFDFIESASQDSKVLIHCSQGVSRSVALTVAYLMWKQGRCYDDVFIDVKAARGIANPNIGFICQLLQWWKRIQPSTSTSTPSSTSTSSSSPQSARLYRMCPQSTSAPRYLIPKCISPATKSSLDPRGAFVFHIPTTNHVYIWAGAQCPDAFVNAAKHFAGQLKKYEGAGLLGGEEAPVVRQGSEPQELLIALLGGPSSSSINNQNGSGAVDNDNKNKIKRTASKQQGRSSSPRPAPSTSTTTTTTTTTNTTNGARLVIEENSSYDKEYEMWERAMTSGTGGLSGASSARSNGGTAGGRKTPRDLSDSATSPNDRLRKYARPELPTVPSLQQQQQSKEEEEEEEEEEGMSPLRDGRKKHSGKGTTRGRGRSANNNNKGEEEGLIAAKLSTDTPITSQGRQQQQEEGGGGGASLHHHSSRRRSHHHRHHVRGRSDVDVSYIERGVSLDTAAAQLVLAEKTIPDMSCGMGLQRVVSDDTAGLMRAEGGGVRRVMTRSSSRKKEREGREGMNE